MSSTPEGTTAESSGVRRCECGRCFLTEQAIQIHRASCGIERESPPNIVSEDNEEYQEFVEWLDGSMSEVDCLRFKSKTVAPEMGFTARQVGAYMLAIEETRSEDYDVERISYNSATTWEVQHA